MTTDLALIPPTAYVENLKYRREVVQWGWESQDAADALWEMCRQDIHFWINTFCWTYDPRRKPATIPMIEYPYQRDGIDRICAAIDAPHDLVIDKSRDMGASWMILFSYVWNWQFQEDRTFLVASRNEQYVDASGNPKALFWKIDHILNNQPNYLLPARGEGVTRTFGRLTNEENGNTINGESSTENLARGDRRTSILVDEFAAYEQQAGWAVLSATRDTTRCRIFNSTLGLVPGAFESIANNPNFAKLTLHWSSHPEKAVGKYTTPGGKVRSPWYDVEEKRCATSLEVARELDIDYTAAAGSFFQYESLNKMGQHVRLPVLMGRLQHADGVPGQFVETREGNIKLWRTPDAAGRFPADRRYVIGVDVSTGTGASNSVIQVFDRLTGEQVAELVDPAIYPHDLASLACAVGRWFGGLDGEATMVFENVGPGVTYGQLCWKYGYRKFYFRRKEGQHNRPETDFIGLFQNKEEKIRHFNLLRMLMEQQRMLVRSSLALAECREIVYTPDGKVEHKGAQGMDPSGAKTNHGDRASAMSFVAVVLMDGLGPTGQPVREERQLGEFGRAFMERQRQREFARLEAEV